MRVLNPILTNCFLILAATGIFISCYPGGAEFVDELDVVAPKYEAEHTFAILTLIGAGSYAQHDGYSTITYAVSIPLGDTKSFTDKVSGRGVGLDYAKFIAGGESTSIGFTTAWYVMGLLW